MPSKDKIIEDLQAISDQISSQVRTLAISLMAIAWGALIGEPEPLKKVIGNHVFELLMMGGLAFAALLVDWFQYVTGYMCSRSILRNVEKVGDTDGKYDYRGWHYRLRTWFFWGKQLLIIIAAGVFVYILACSIVPHSSNASTSRSTQPATDKTGPSASQR